MGIYFLINEFCEVNFTNTSPFFQLKCNFHGILKVKFRLMNSLGDYYLPFVYDLVIDIIDLGMMRTKT